MKDRLIVFARSPFQAGVKTRLARGVGQQAAQGIYARLLYSLLFRLIAGCPENMTITLSTAGKSGVANFQAAYPELIVDHQCKGNIGVRMGTAIQKALDEGADRVVLIGSDLPDLDWPLLCQAFNNLAPDTIPVGPTRDGGFYLVGMQCPAGVFFQNITWSTDTVLTKLVSNITANGMTPYLLPKLTDIDLPEDWQRWQAQLAKPAE